MDPIMIPLAAFVMVVLIVGIVQVTKVRDKELEVSRVLQQEQMEHQRKLKELEVELERVRQGR
jgi:hypothetical protein